MTFDVRKYFGEIAVVLGFCVFAAYTLLAHPFDGEFHVYFLDVDQGDATFIVSPDGHQILIDGGPANYVIEELGEVMGYFDNTIDMIVLTHPHADHVDGLVEVLKRYEVDSVLLAGTLAGEAGYLEFLREIREQKIEVFIAESGMDFEFGEVIVDVVYPFESFYGKSFDNVNNSSIVLNVEYRDHSILLTGDAEIEVEEELVEAGVLEDIDIYQAGHHGSKTSNSLTFLAIVRPEVVVISCGKENRFGHPHDEAMDNFELVGVETVRRIDLEGRIEITFF